MKNDLEKDVEMEGGILDLLGEEYLPKKLKIPVEDFKGKQIPGRYFDSISMNFRKLQVYSTFLSLEEIILFEFFTMLSPIFGNKPFYQQKHRIQENTRLGKHRIDKAILKLKVLGILNVQSGTHKNKNLYSVNYDRVVELIPKIFDIDETKTTRAKKRQYISHEYAMKIYTEYFTALSYIGYKEDRYLIDEET